ncbi:MAG TPA: 2-isopropylmalate synthase, partial [Caulobacteraceae bacterium]|nr:2-isopropylmalate synthase [Caulobacteraceae bacterium]
MTASIANAANETRVPSGVSDHVVIFDTTMRDGEQSPGASMSIEEKLELAKI